MKISDLVTLSAKNLARRKGRTALTVVGVVVGTCAVIVMISLGIAASKSNEEMLATWGDLTQIEIFSDSGTVSSAKNAPPSLNDAMLETLRAMAHVTAVTPYYQSYNMQGTVTAGKNGRYAADWSSLSAQGMDIDAMQKMGFTLQSGSWIADSDTFGKDKIPVYITGGTAYNFHDTRRNERSAKYQRYQEQTDDAGNPVQPFFDATSTPMTLTLTDGSTDNPKTKTYTLVVAGVLTEDTSKGYFTRRGMVMRLSDYKLLEAEAKKLQGQHPDKNTAYSDVYVKVDEVNNVDGVDKSIQALGFTTYSMTSVRASMQKQVAKNQLILGGLAAISLLVAALNIANTMTMAIYERTREIGVMKVLGCELGYIRGMFLFESGFIGFIGGVVGSVISLGVSFILNHVADIMQLLGISQASSGDDYGMMSATGSMGGSTIISIVPVWLVLAALVFATVIGLLSGLAPANRAVKISALEAIRHE